MLLKLQGSNEPQSPSPGVRGEDLTSEAGGLLAHDKSSRGVEVKKAKAKEDISLINEPPQGESRSPKA